MLFWVLELTATILGYDISHKRIVLGAVIGAVLFCCILVGVSAPVWMKLIIGCGMVSILVVKYVFSMEWKIEIFMVTTLAIVCAVIFGGLLEITCKFIPFFQIDTKCLVLSASVLGVVTKTVLYKICNYEKSEFCQVVILLKGKPLKFQGILDTGNGLVDPVTQNKVSVISLHMAQEIKEICKQEKFKLIPFSTIGETGLLPAYEIPFMILIVGGRKKIVKHPILAIAHNMKENENKYDMIIPINIDQPLFSKIGIKKENET